MEQFDLQAFSVPFVLFSVDLWLHAPVRAPLNHIGLGFSLAVVPLGAFEWFVAAEALWIGLLLVGLVEGAEKTPPKEVKKEAVERPTREVGPPSLPQEGSRRLEEALKKLVGNLNDVANAEGKQWKLQDSKDGIKISSSDVPGESMKRWKVETIINGASLDELMLELFDYDRRVGKNGWDTAIKEGKVLQTFKDDNFSLSRMVTNAAAGGNVSSREFFDLRGRYLPGQHPEAPQGGVLIVMTGLDPKKDKKWLPQLPNPDKSLVVGTTFPGAGVRISPVPGKENTFQYTLVSTLKLGGWLPSSLINSVTAGALMDSHQAMHTHLKKKFA